MQPTYLPWCGYFDLIDRSDIFVFLDDVQFSFGSWQQKNRVKGHHGAEGVSVPVIRPSAWRDALIHTVEIDNSKSWRDRHWHTIEVNYHEASYFPLYVDALKQMYLCEWTLMSDLSKTFIRKFAEWLGISSCFIDSRPLGVTGNKVEKIIGICKALNATEYLSPVGAFAYMTNSELFAAEGIQLRFQHFQHPIYRQLYGKFEPFLSVVDLLMNEGEASLSTIRSGQRPFRSYDQMREIETLKIAEAAELVANTEGR